MPLSVRERGDKDKYDGPHEGVPDWLFPSLWGWVDGRLPSARYQGVPWPDGVAIYRRMAAALRTSFDDRGDPDGGHVDRGLHEYVSYDPVRLLDVTDWILHYMMGRDASRYAEVQKLNGLLATAGSVYEVIEDERGELYLSRRVTLEMKASAEEAMRPADKASSHLSAAWRAVHGRDPNPGHGYLQAVKAIEVVAIPVVSPKNGSATLGTVIRDIRAAPGSWLIALHNPSREDQTLAFAQILELIWKGELRHGDPRPDVPLDVTLPEAEAALHLAIPVVKWFRDGTIRRA